MSLDILHKKSEALQLEEQNMFGVENFSMMQASINREEFGSQRSLASQNGKKAHFNTYL
jgi:hypothetical protein